MITKTVEEVVDVHHDAKLYNLKVNETQLVELAALLGNCSGYNEIYWDIMDILDKNQLKKYRQHLNEFGDCFSDFPRLS